MPVPRIILITGATRGLGRAMADGFIARGCTVAGCGGDVARIGELRSTHGPPHRFDSCSLRLTL